MHKKLKIRILMKQRNWSLWGVHVFFFNLIPEIVSAEEDQADQARNIP